jgi:hypothetical protein
MKHLISVIWFGLLFFFNGNSVAQNYQAIQGSSYAGSLGVHDNPASIVNTPFKWDVTVFGAQLKSSTNAYTIHDYSILGSPAKSKYEINSGEYSRYARLNANINLLNARIALNRKHAIAFGVNFKSYSNLSTSGYNYLDSVKNTGDFLKINPDNNNFTGNFLSSSWFEFYGSYASTIIDNESGRLNAGISVKLSRGISGAYLKLNNLQYSSNAQNNTTVYDITNASFQYGYSSNYDRWLKGNTTNQNLNNFLAYTEGGASFDAGLEYLVKTQDPTSYGNDESYFDYDWKFGLSFLDIGGNQYKYGVQSRAAFNVKTNVNNLVLDQKFDSTIKSVKTFNDSLSTIIGLGVLGGKFTVLNPMRIVLNADRYITDAFYINATLSINIPTSFLKKYLAVKELNFLSVTPRWETKRLGFYLPVTFNNENQFWIGGAIKLGPLLFGVHNWANIFSKTKMQNGGGYIALTFRAPGNTGGRGDKTLNCPKPVW